MMKKKRKEAVLIIENARYYQLHRRELKLLRTYLGKLPYQCRTVYFKFVDVKRSSNQLMNSYMAFVGSNQELAQALNLRYSDCFETKKKK